jgi:hypothetical protein
VDTLLVLAWQKPAPHDGNRVFTTPAYPIEIERKPLSFARASGMLTLKSNSHSALRVRNGCNHVSTQNACQGE